MSFKTQHLQKLLKSILKNDYVTIEVLGYSITEELKDEETKLTIEFKINSWLLDEKVNGHMFSCEAKGKGFIDALFCGLFDCVKDYSGVIIPKNFTPSIASFNIVASGNTKDKATGNLSIHSKNRKLVPFIFKAEDFSINAVSLSVVIQAIEFILNTCCAYQITQEALKDAKKRHRVDLIEIGTKRLIDLVEVMDFS